MKKEKTILEYAIKIRRVRDEEKIGDRSWKFTDKFFLIDIRDSIGGGIGFAVKIGGNYGYSLRKVFREIISNLHL